MKRICVVGAGPSLAQTLPDLIAVYKSGVPVATANHSHDWLVKHGVMPTICVMPESYHHTRIEKTVRGCTYYLRADARPETKDTVSGANTKTFNIGLNTNLTVRGLPVLNVLHSVGYRDFELFGYDGSYPEDGNTHMDGTFHWAQQKHQNDNCIRWCAIGGKVFKSHKRWRHQTRAMIELLTKRRDRISVKIHGDGMLAHLAAAIDDIAEGGDEDEPGPFTKGAEIWMRVKGDKYTMMVRPASKKEAEMYIERNRAQ